MTDIHSKIELAMRDKNLNIRQTAEVCGLKYSTFHSAMKNRREIGMSTINALCDGLGISILYFSQDTPLVTLSEYEADTSLERAAIAVLNHRLSGKARQFGYSGTQITLETFLDWWVSNGGRLEGFDGLAERVDMFEPPDGESKLIKPVKIGAESLATKCFFLEETDHLNQTLKGFTEQANESLVRAHLEACKRGEPIITHPFLDEKLRDGSRFVRRYRRVLAPVYLRNGKKMVVNFSQDLGSD